MSMMDKEELQKFDLQFAEFNRYLKYFQNQHGQTYWEHVISAAFSYMAIQEMKKINEKLDTLIDVTGDKAKGE